MRDRGRKKNPGNAVTENRQQTDNKRKDVTINTQTQRVDNIDYCIFSMCCYRIKKRIYGLR